MYRKLQASKLSSGLRQPASECTGGSSTIPRVRVRAKSRMFDCSKRQRFRFTWEYYSTVLAW
jgi:hypothetical protein